MNREEKIKCLNEKSRYGFDDLVSVMELLRQPGGCPWDIEQTHKSIRNDFIEETYEAIEAIDTDNPVLLKEELGDVLLQVAFHSQIEHESGRFDIYDVTNDVCAKLIHRHPHVFGTVHVDNSEQVLENWNVIKGEEKTDRVTMTDKLNAVPKMLPALMRAAKVGKKAKCFDFADSDQVFAKLYEEAEEVKRARDSGSREEIDEEIGDLLLTVTSLARKLGTDPEEALSRATDKFIYRFSVVENEVNKQNKNMDRMSMTELDGIWDRIKHPGKEKK